MKINLFKNATAFRVTPGFRIDPDKLAHRPARDCSPLEGRTDGFLEPCDHSTRALVHDVGGFNLICWQTQERLLPGSVVAERVAECAAELEQQQGRPLGRKQLKELKQRVTEELLPKAFTQDKPTYAVFAGEYFIIDTASAARADALLDALRSALDELPLALVSTEVAPTSRMTDWLLASSLYGLTVDDCAVLEGADERKPQVTYQRTNLDDDEVRSRISEGFLPRKVAVTIKERLSCHVDDGLVLTRINPVGLLNLTVESETAKAESLPEQFDSQVAIMVSEIVRALDFLVADMGGFAKPEEDLVTKAETFPTVEEVTEGIKKMTREIIHEGYGDSSDLKNAGDDPLYEQAVQVVQANQRASILLVQNNLRIGYNRAARLIETMEKRGVVSTMNARGECEVLA